VSALEPSGSSAPAGVPERGRRVGRPTLAMIVVAALVGGVLAWMNGAAPARRPWLSASDAYERRALVFWQALRRRDVARVRTLLLPASRRQVPALNLALALRGEFGTWLAATAPTVVESEPIAGGRRVVLRVETRRPRQPVSELGIGLVGVRVIRQGDRLYVDATSWLRKQAGLDPLSPRSSRGKLNTRKRPTRGARRG